jgi:hypothetical protein
MKAGLFFNLPEEDELYELHKNGPDLRYKVDEFDNWLRSITKYDAFDSLNGDYLNTENLTDEEKTLVHNVTYAIRAKMWRFISGE